VGAPLSEKNSGGVPSVAELRPIVQGSKVRADQRWTYRLFRSVSIYITWLLIHTKVTANQVTVASLVVAAIGLVLVAFSSPWIALIGYLMLLTYHLLDRVDGEIARFRETFSLRGIYLDNAGHYLTGAGVFIATAYRYAPGAADPQIVWLVGTIGAIAVVMARVEKHAAFQLFSQYVLERPQLLDGMSPEEGAMTRASTRADRAAGPSEHRRSPLGAVRDLALTLTSFPIVVVAFIVGLIVAAVWDTPDAAIVILAVAAALQVMTYLALEVVNLTQNLDAESLRLAETAQTACEAAADDRSDDLDD